MPNYAWNRMSMKASDYKKYVEGIDENGNPTVDFNVLIPVPKCYTEYSSDTYTDRCFVYYISDRLSKDWDGTAKEIRKLLPNDPAWRFCAFDSAYSNLLHRPMRDEELDNAYEFGKRIAENIKEHGSKDWYDWCCDNWGTKWNAFDVEVEDIDEENDICWFKFTTAWCPPEGWIKELSKHCDFTLNCEVEGSDTRYRYVCENGVLRYFESEFVEKELK